MITFYNVRQAFDRHIDRLFPRDEKTEINAFLKRHERKQVCLERIMREIQLAEKRKRLDLAALDLIIRGSVNIFAHAALLEHKHRTMSESERRNMRAKEDRLKEAEAHIRDLEKDATPKAKVFT